MHENEGWLTHLSAGVLSQLEIPSANHLHYKVKEWRLLRTFTYILRIPIYRTVVVCEKTSLHHFDEGRFFISQISPKGKREMFESLFTLFQFGFVFPKPPLYKRRCRATARRRGCAAKVCDFTENWCEKASPTIQSLSHGCAVPAPFTQGSLRRPSGNTKGNWDFTLDW